jgi:predicted DNA-binding transcriptional regulator AlpA
MATTPPRGRASAPPPPVPEPSPITVRAKRAASMLGVSERTLWSLTSPRGPIPCIRLADRLVLYRVADLEAWVANAASARPEALPTGAPPPARSISRIGDAGDGA